MDELSRLAADYLKTLCLEIPNRSVGAPGNKLATRFFREVMEENGLAVESQPFDCIDLRSGEIHLQAGGQDFKAHISPYSLGCDVTAPLFAASTIEELEALDARGKLLLLHGEIAREQIMPRNFAFYNPGEHQRVYRTLDAVGPAAIISAAGRNSDLTAALYPYPMFEDGDFDIPSCFIKDVEGEGLLAFVGKKARLYMDAERIPEKAENIISHAGTNPQGKIVITAHIDAKVGTPGALDDGGGTVVLMLLAHLLRSYSGERMIEIASLNGEDYWSAGGQMEYIRRNADTWDQMRLLINIDGAGYRGFPTGISYYECPEDLTAAAKKAQADFPSITDMDPWFMGDHMIFVQNGVPAAALTTANFVEVWKQIAHTEKDSIDIVDPALLVEAACFIRAWIEVLG